MNTTMNAVERESLEASRRESWLKDHGEEYAGKWVAMLEGNVLGVGTTSEEARRAAEARGVRPWFLFRVPGGSTEPVEDDGTRPTMSDVERKARVGEILDEYFVRRSELMRRLAAGVDDPIDGGTGDIPGQG